MMNWQQRIEVKESVLTGKPIIKGTRLSVGFLLGLFAEGWSETQVLDSYLQLCRDDLQAVFAFSAACLHDEQFFAQSPAV